MRIIDLVKSLLWRMAAHSLSITAHLSGMSLLLLIIFWMVMDGDKIFTAYNILILFPATYGLTAIISIMFIWSLVRLVILKLNGHPFKEGDLVEILRGAHRGEKAQIYEVWEPRNEVRLDLGSEAKKKVEDVFEMHHIHKIASK